MGEIIKLASSKKFLIIKKRQEKARRCYYTAIARVLAYVFCLRRCAYCKQYIEKSQLPLLNIAPYPFCFGCLEEYRAFRRREEGQRFSEAPWHTDEWIKMWQVWLTYKRASEKFRQSNAFLNFMGEYKD